MRVLKKVGVVAETAREKLGDVVDNAKESVGEGAIADAAKAVAAQASIARNAAAESGVAATRKGALVTKRTAKRTAEAARTAASRALELSEDISESVGEVATPVVRVAKDKAGQAAEAVKEGAQTAGKAGAGVARRSSSAVARGVGKGAKSAAVVAEKGGRRAKVVGTAAWDKVDDRLETVWTVVSETFVETVGETLRQKVLDDDAMTKLFGTVYGALPADVRRWVSEEQFVAFCFKNRNRLMALPESKAAEPAPALPPANAVRRVDL